ncbi:hypothetical protein MWU77_23925 [Rhodococcus sp. F64268]|uniref:hypothetical protein n=1 Tax=Rhodococcus sp. F64268 TaxID=2926402 RepID=UPI001FF416E7|nr:hypothetical protein [Rhodococcus sp. F64268]MCK0093820.1 hypothetical protein [Rhodococcus sp. F64268]
MHNSNRKTASEHAADAKLPSGFQPWPQAFRPSQLAASVAVALAAALSGATAWNGARGGEPLTALGFAGLSLTTLLVSVGLLQESGFRHIALPRRISRHTDGEHGPGVTVPMSRSSIPAMITILVGVTAYGLIIWIGWLAGVSDSLVPFGRDTREVAILSATGAAVTGVGALLLASVRFTTALRIYPNGIRRYARRRIVFSIRESDLFLHWDEIAQISPGELGVRVGSAPHPVINLTTTSSVPSALRTQHDADYSIAIMAHTLVSEPNTLFALLKRLHENPHDRNLINEPSAAELLRPPPLRERFRSARAQKAKA